MEGPSHALAAFLLGSFSYHAVMIECSKHQIRAYVYGAADYRTVPEFRPHLIFRVGCGNAVMGMVYGLYGGTALEGRDDPDPNVRAKALRMSLHVSGFFLNGMDDTMKVVVRKALSDPSPRVQDVVREFELTPDAIDRK